MRGMAVGVVLALGVAACGGDDAADTTDDTADDTEEAEETEDDASEDAAADGEELSGEIAIDGSSTVTPHTIPAAELFQEENPGVRIAVATSGTGGGFEKFCNGETDISMASRSIKDTEIEACEEAGITYDQLGVANDGLAVIVNPENDWAQCLSVDDLNAFWAPDSDVTTWSEVNPEWPDEQVVLFGPGSDSGTYDFFTEAVNGEEGAINPNYTDIGEDDNAAIDGVASAVGNMGYVPLSFVEESGGAVVAVEIENADGECVSPSEETVQDGSYNPLGRQLFIYPSGSSLERPEVLAFLEFYINNQEEIAREALFIPLTAEQEQEALDKVNDLVG
jgi:phosphate transport system substrate-binding protein